MSVSIQEQDFLNNGFPYMNSVFELIKNEYYDDSNFLISDIKFTTNTLNVNFEAYNYDLYSMNNYELNLDTDFYGFICNKTLDKSKDICLDLDMLLHIPSTLKVPDNISIYLLSYFLFENIKNLNHS